MAEVEQEQQQQQQQEQKVELTADEVTASDKGWVPLDKWVEAGSDEADHRSAAMFLANRCHQARNHAMRQ